MTPQNFIIPDSGPFRPLYSLYRSNRRFARMARSGGVLVVLDKNKPVLYVRAHRNILWADECTLYDQRLCGVLGKEYLRSLT